MQTKYEVGDTLKSDVSPQGVVVQIEINKAIFYRLDNNHFFREDRAILIQPVGSPFKVGCVAITPKGNRQFIVSKIERNNNGTLLYDDIGNFDWDENCNLVITDECSTKVEITSVERHNEDLRNCLNAIGDALKIGGSFSYFSLPEKIQELIDANNILGKKCSRLERRSNVLAEITKLIGLPPFVASEEVLRRLQRVKKILSEGIQYLDI